jgi:uncharacterized membrane protein
MSPPEAPEQARGLDRASSENNQSGRPPSRTNSSAPKGGSEPGPTGVARRRGVGLLLRDARFWLAIIVVAFFGVSVWSGVAAYNGLSTRLGGGNLGIFMQSFSSTNHGQIPFFESSDCLAKFRCSFLLVHPGFAVMYPVAPFYALWPSAVFLFLVQSAGVALAAVPLFYLTRRVTNSSAKGLLAAGLYLAWAPLLAGEAFSFGLESFLPLEMFTIAALWQAKHYRLGFLAAIVAFLTFEINPIFVLLIGLFFLSPAFESALRGAALVWKRWRKKQVRAAAGLSAWIRWCVRVAAQRDVAAAILLTLSSVAAIFLVFGFMNVFGAQLLGAPTPSVGYGSGNLFYENSGSQQNGLPLSTVLHSPGLLLTNSQTPVTAVYWLILLGLVGFVPLLSFRAWILLVPWIGYTFLSASFRFATIGLAADSISAVPVFLALAYGLGRLPPLRWAPTVRPTPAAAPAASPDPPASSGWRTRSTRSSYVAWIAVITTLATVNVLLCSVVPIVPDMNVNLAAPFRGDYYMPSTGGNSGIAAVEQLVGLVPMGASVGVPTQLYPLVANNPDSYILTPHVVVKRLPFNTSGWPQFVVVDGYGSFLPTTLLADLGKPSSYAARGFVASTSEGAMVLYERGYSGGAMQCGGSSPSAEVVDSPGAGLAPGPEGVLLTSSRGSTISTTPNPTGGGVVARSSEMFLAPGAYSLRMAVKAIRLSPGGKNSSVVSTLGLRGFAGFSQNLSFTEANFTANLWTNLTWSFEVAGPILFADVALSLLSLHYSLQLGALLLQPRAEP